MKSLDNDLIHHLCHVQGNLFAESVNYNFSSENFYWFFLKHPDVCKMDQGEYEDYYYLFKQIKTKKKKNIKYEAKAMQWIGYITRYIALTTEFDSNDIANAISCEELRQFYPSLHTQDPGWARDRILEIKKDKFIDKNKALKRLLTEEEASKIITH